MKIASLDFSWLLEVNWVRKVPLKQLQLELECWIECSAVSWFAGWGANQLGHFYISYLFLSLSAPSSYHLAISKLVPIALLIYNFAFCFPPLPRSMFYLLIFREELRELHDSTLVYYIEWRTPFFSLFIALINTINTMMVIKKTALIF